MGVIDDWGRGYMEIPIESRRPAMRKFIVTARARRIGVTGGIGLVLLIWGVLWAQEPPTRKPGPAPAAPAIAGQTNPEISSHPAKARLDLARQAMKILRRTQESWDFGTQSEYDDTYRWSLRAIEALRELGGNKADLIAALEEHRAWMSKWEGVARDRHARGTVKTLTLLEVRYRVMEAESWLAEAKASK